MDVSSVSGVVVLDELGEGGVVIFAGFEVVIILAPPLWITVAIKASCDLVSCDSGGFVSVREVVLLDF